MEFDCDCMSVDRIPGNHLLLMHDAFVWADYPQTVTKIDIKSAIWELFLTQNLKIPRLRTLTF
jgi:hypothetical protein